MSKHKYIVVGQFVRPHKDCDGETIENLDYDEAIKICEEWRKQKRKYKNVSYEKYEVD